jgi:hypothetical protein
MLIEAAPALEPCFAPRARELQRLAAEGQNGRDAECNNEVRMNQVQLLGEPPAIMPDLASVQLLLDALELSTKPFCIALPGAMKCHRCRGNRSAWRCRRIPFRDR